MLALAAAAWIAAPAHCDDDLQDLADKIGGAAALEHPIPDVPDDLSEATAYRVQALWVPELYGTPFAGYKAGLTSAQSQARFGVTKPVLGILPGVARMKSGDVLARNPGLKVEVEIAFLVGQDRAPAAMLPAVELPRLSFASPGRMTLADIVASDVSAYRFVAGLPAFFDPSVRDTTVTLTRDGKELNRATARDALGDPLESYRWMVAKLDELGYVLEPGMIMLTGALGRIVDGEPGKYVAHYEGLGDVTFTIR